MRSSAVAETLNFEAGEDFVFEQRDAEVEFADMLGGIGEPSMGGRILSVLKSIADSAPDAADQASLFTPVPGGTGPVTNAMLLRNTLELYESQLKLSSQVP